VTEVVCNPAVDLIKGTITNYTNCNCSFITKLI
jgi:hypothetical protein